MCMDIVAQKFNSFVESERADREYYRSLTPQQRLDILLDLMAKAYPEAVSQPLERVYRIVKLHKNS
jgi:hypothetical protein